MPSPTVVLQSVTGVDIELRIAGPGNRSYAFVIDWHIRLLMSLAWLLAGMFLYTGSFSFLADDSPKSSWFFLLVVLPSTAIYFLYHPVLEIAMHGRTPGKRIAGVRLVSRTGDIPGIGPLLVRNVFRIIDSMPFVYLVGLCSVMFTAQHVRIGDLAAGTLLVMDDKDSARSLAGLQASGGLAPQAMDLIHELLDRWNELDEVTRANLARSLIARVDPSVSAQDLTGKTPYELQSHLRTLLTSDRAA